MFNRKKRPKREFRPQSHATIYLIAVIYLGYLLFQMIGDAIEGGANAPSALHMVAAVLVLGGGMVLLAILAWRMYRLKPRQDDGDSAQEVEEEQASLPEAEDEAEADGLEEGQEDDPEAEADGEEEEP